MGKCSWSGPTWKVLSSHQPIVIQRKPKSEWPDTGINAGIFFHMAARWGSIFKLLSCFQISQRNSVGYELNEVGSSRYTPMHIYSSRLTIQKRTPQWVRYCYEHLQIFRPSINSIIVLKKHSFVTFTTYQDVTAFKTFPIYHILLHLFLTTFYFT